jgi:hypothetical protein
MPHGIEACLHPLARRVDVERECSSPTGAHPEDSNDLEVGGRQRIVRSFNESQLLPHEYMYSHAPHWVNLDLGVSLVLNT